MSKLEAIYIEWMDHATYHGWKDPNQPFSPSPIATLGWLIQEDKKQLVVSPAIAFDDDGSPTSCAEPTVIIKATVTKRVDIELPKGASGP